MLNNKTTTRTAVLYTNINNTLNTPAAIFGGGTLLALRLKYRITRQYNTLR